MAGRRQQGEGSVYQRSRDKRWIAVADLGWRDGRRDRREFTGRTPKEAMDRRQSFLDRRRDGFTMPRGRPPTVADWMLHWLHNIAKREVAQTTWEGSYRQKVTDLICPFFERIPLAELTEEDIEDWHLHLESTPSRYTGRPVSASTIGQAHRIMSRALKVAVARKRMPRNPCSNVTPPAARETEIRPPSAAEVEKILARCETWPAGARWALAIMTGLRQGEVLALEWQHLHLDDPAWVQVEWSAARVAGERIRKRPKSRTSRRPVPLPQRAARMLRAYRASLPVTPVGAALVFTRPDGRPVHPRADWQDWQDLLAGLGLPRYRVHDIRHGYATMLLERGVDPRVAQAMLGHASGALLTRYQHVRPVMHQQVAAVIDEALGAGS